MLIKEEQLFAEAIDIADSENRAAFLDEACGDDSLLREKLDQLVEIHFSSGKLLDETRDGSVNDTIFTAGPKVGDSIGSYKLLQEIGDGGMGIVFMAEQSRPVRRMVAVKVIKLGMDTRRVIARFESERQALALMDHPCITKVLDAGSTESGRPYFVMDLVRGKSITEFCDEKKIPLRQRMALFAQVCAAVEHAHQKGIIHRDIKPSNIMVTNNDGVPLPKVIDFGISKAINQQLTEKTLFTNYGEMVGTPLYMSPEQAEMNESDVDTRSDVYSLGVLLYELVTGSSPHGDLKRRNFHEIRQAICSSDPILASTRISKLGETVGKVAQNRNTDSQTLKRFVRGELDWILAKCLARDRSHRYQSAGELAREIQRYLNGEMVEAAKPTLRYRTRKFITRYRAAVATAATIAVVLCFSTFVSVTMAMRARDAEHLANRRLDEVVAERDRAQEAESQLAILERKQREQSALNEAIARHNANMVKRIMTPDGERTIPGEEKFYVKPVSSLWSFHKHDKPDTPGAPDEQPWQMNIRSHSPPVERKQVTLGGDFGNENIEVVMLADEGASQADLLKCLVKVQRQNFGANDMTVAVTLNQLGEVMAKQKNWKESEQFFREAIGIVNNLAQTDPEYLSEIRVRLVDCLKDKGDWEEAFEELKEFKSEFKDSRFVEDLTRQLEILKSRDFEIETDHDDDSDK